MSNDNNNNEEINTNALHNLMFFIIIALLCAILYFSVKTYWLVDNPVDIEKLQYYNTHLQK